ncbi:molecular chaperone DjlA [Solemya pervernicosa gill symbiont]|uniref:Co-chaperone protein DjlA n=2 Tax=Gammaproteobacteria incertae sedis TaxID=118884 RepID=A0A1T2L2B0_9GAMM|nr:co-chaperone DjlA [Candidatus Reidiella endopervernicosa]OOZ39211.1 molecular chaperone DjlA [Solemya pervernicosa gill symbiont]QKQ28058.1 co-chaperone DjlA [Candidatus Reidiella endopervernicosa]
MSWWGKMVGGAFGFMLGGPLGAVLGAALGHKFDQGLGAFQVGGTAHLEQERIQTAFFTATFSVMGHLAKADGRVSEDEIAFAKAVMAQMQLGEEQRALAIKLFGEGKADDFPLDDLLHQFRKECHRRRTLMQMFIEIQLQAAHADGRVDSAERKMLQHICDLLGFTQHEFEHLEAMASAARNFGSGGAAGGGYQQPQQASPQAQLKAAYQVLDVVESATDAEVKRAYRRLMNQHHPDKLVSKGLPEEMIKVATEKSQEIRNAYDAVKASRGMR